jgi:glycosyltransferase involved in cell wall biosynthesis
MKGKLGQIVIKLKKRFKMINESIKEFHLLKKGLQNADNYFFFPTYGLGGAERVHLDILTVFKGEKNIVFFTKETKEGILLEQYQELATCFELTTTEHQFYKRFMLRYLLKNIANKINQQSHTVVFGCQYTNLFYQIVPFLKDSIHVIDLLHAVVHTEKSDNFNLSVIKRINNRIVLGEINKKRLMLLYKNNLVSENEYEKIKVIPNKFDFCKKEIVKDNNIIKILFVGRNSKEKRTELFVDIAKKMIGKNCHFYMIGNFTKEYAVLPNLTIVGLIKEREILNDYFKDGHILLITSIYEGLPMVILEAMANKVVPICTDVGDISSYVSEYFENGIIIPNEDNEENLANNFVLKINNLIANFQLLEKYSENGPVLIEEHFSSENFENKYKEIFKQNKI